MGSIERYPMALTDTKLKNLKPTDKVYKVVDRVHVREVIQQVYRHAMSRGFKIKNPAEAVKASAIATFKPRERALTPGEIHLYRHRRRLTKKDPSNGWLAVCRRLPDQDRSCRWCLGPGLFRPGGSSGSCRVYPDDSQLADQILAACRDEILASLSPSEQVPRAGNSASRWLEAMLYCFASRPSSTILMTCSMACASTLGFRFSLSMQLPFITPAKPCTVDQM